MNHRFYLLLLSAPLVAGCATEQTVAGGNPQTLAPLLGKDRMAMPPPKTTKPPEVPVVDYVADLGSLRLAWPQVEAQLPRLIRSLIARGSWVGAYHRVLAADGVLRVRHRQEVVDQVRNLTHELEARLLRPIQVQVAFIELDQAVSTKVLSPSLNAFSPKAFAAAVNRAQARDLARTSFATFNGRWASRERLERHNVLAGITKSGGAVYPRTTTVTTGTSMQAAAWLWDERRAVVAIAGSYTGPAKGGTTVKQQLHQKLPQTKKDEWPQRIHQAEFTLPLRELVEYSGKLTVARGSWTLAAVFPREDSKTIAVVVRADWVDRKAPERSISPLAKNKAFVLRVIPVALPAEVRSPKRLRDDGVLANKQMLEAQADQLKRRIQTRQRVQKSNTFNFQSLSGSLSLPTATTTTPKTEVKTFFTKTESSYFHKKAHPQRRAAPRSVLGAMPPQLEVLKREVLRERWPAGSALEYSANHVFVVHQAKVADKVMELLKQTHQWRNQKVALGFGFPRLKGGAGERLKSAQVSVKELRQLKKGKAVLGPARLLTRGGSRSEIVVAEMHSVLSAPWIFNRASPGVHVYYRGARLSALPQLGPEVGQKVHLRFNRYALSNTAPKAITGAVLQQPVVSSWNHQRELKLGGGPTLTGFYATHGHSAVMVVERLQAAQ